MCLIRQFACDLQSQLWGKIARFAPPCYYIIFKSNCIIPTFWPLLASVSHPRPARAREMRAAKNVEPLNKHDMEHQLRRIRNTTSCRNLNSSKNRPTSCCGCSTHPTFNQPVILILTAFVHSTSWTSSSLLKKTHFALVGAMVCR